MGHVVDAVDERAAELVARGCLEPPPVALRECRHGVSNALDVGDESPAQQECSDEGEQERREHAGQDARANPRQWCVELVGRHDHQRLQAVVEQPQRGLGGHCGIDVVTT
ncbi:MAG TPA: hypothetical protein VHB97_23075, partial [Polyangia bacterium]|nr:hypothetical protein [Polyangia bacterium]